ncbi:MAG: WxcM-like domain-containing protein [Rikenellaceae bacterium]
MANSEIKIIEGEVFADHRGKICSLNNFRFPGVERFYFIHHENTEVIRGWHGHQHEKKWFYCVKGSFTMAFVKIDDWDTPSEDLEATIVELTEENSKIVCIPEGYANCIKASSPDSTLMVLSGKILEEALNDSWRYDSSLWVDWSKY